MTGVKLIYPALTNKRPTKGQGHLHYRVDDGPVIATTTTKLSFHELTSGKHQIVVMLANNDHSPTGLERAFVPPALIAPSWRFRATMISSS